MSQPGSGAFSVPVVYETSRTRTGGLAAEAMEKSQEAIIRGRVNVPKKKEKESDAARLARLRRELAKPHLTKSVREKATKKQIASWNAG